MVNVQQGFFCTLITLILADDRGLIYPFKSVKIRVIRILKILCTFVLE